MSRLAMSRLAMSRLAMSRLATRIGSLDLPNPVICGSGEPVMTEAGIRAALAAGAAGVVAKSVNERPEAAAQLDRADYVFLGDSLLCRSGLIQRSAEDWFAALARLDREAAADGRFVAASLVLASANGAERIAAQARQAGLRVFELNVGAPHASEASPGVIVQETDPAQLRALVRQTRDVTAGMQLWVKLTGLSSNLPALAVAAGEAGADAVVMMGRFMAMAPDIDTLAPMLGTSGAYGGPWALPIVCRFLALSRRAAGPDYPLLGTNGARSGADIARFALAGASAVEVLSVVMQEGFGAITRILGELDTLLTERGYVFTDMIGSAADRLTSYSQQAVRPGLWRDFVPPETSSSVSHT